MHVTSPVTFICFPVILLCDNVIQHHRDPEKILAFSKDAVNQVVEAYLPIVRKHKDDPFTEEQKNWQQIRRGRCV